MIKTTTVIKTALPISRPSLDGKAMAEKYDKRIRKGKTKRDHANGYAKRNADRKAARAAWQQDSRATNATFPV